MRSEKKKEIRTKNVERITIDDMVQKSEGITLNMSIEWSRSHKGHSHLL